MKSFNFSILCLALIIASCLSAQSYDIYVSDAGNFNNPPWKIIKYDSSGGNPSTFIDTVLAWPQDILFLEDSGTVLISNLNTGRITKYNASTGQYIGNFASGLSGPTRMKIGPDSLLYILQWQGNGRIKRYRLDGTFHSDFSTVGVIQSIGLDWDKKGNLYVSSFSGKNVRKFGPTGTDSGLFVNSNLLGPTNIWFDDNGELLVIDYSGTAVKRYDTNGVFKSNYINNLGQAEGVDFLANGDILIGNGNSRSVKRYAASGSFIKDIIPSGSGGLMTPNAVVIREQQIVSVPEISLEAPQVIPSMGRDFYFSTARQEIQHVDIINLSGQVIERRKINDLHIWNAESAPKGIYLLLFHHESGALSNQKIIVH